MKVPPCPLCFGKRPFCIHKSYPLPEMQEFGQKVHSLLKEEVAGPSYSLFVGKHGYPDVGVGPMVGIAESSLAAATPDQWFGKSYGQIIKARSLIVRSSQKEHIFSRSRFIEENQLLALTKKPTETELTFIRKPHYSFMLSDYQQPMGPTGQLKTMQVTENPKVLPAVEKIVHDDLSAREASFSLYKKKQDVYKITTILSSGVLGSEQRKKLVPTRWSITATDDTIAKEMLPCIRDSKEVHDYLVFEADYMDNHFTILLMPGSWEFENFEAWAPGSTWFEGAGQSQRLDYASQRIIREYEPFDGRTTYAKDQAGGYYATRLAVVEYLYKTKRQAQVLSFREVGDHYTIPLGVWVVRETARQAMKQKPKQFAAREEALAYVMSRNRLPLEAYRLRSTILSRRTLGDFISL